MKSEREVIQSCATLSDPMDCSLPGSSVHGIFQARVLEWVAIAFSEYDYRSILILIRKMILQTAHLKQSSSVTRWTEESSRLYSEIMDLGVLSCV